MATTLQLPNAFKISYSDFSLYPQNLVYQTSYPSALTGYRTRLDDSSSRLFVTKDTDLDIVFRDYNGQAFERKNVRGDEKKKISGDVVLREWMGDKSIIDPITCNITDVLATKKDPKCRFM